jgi:hypothetical protein
MEIYKKAAEELAYSSLINERSFGPYAEISFS